MAKKTTDITQDMPVDVYLMEVVGPTMTKIQDNLHELKKKVESLEGHPVSGLSSSEDDDLAEKIAGKVVSKMPTPKVVQTEPKEPSTMLQSFGSVNTKLDTAISYLQNLTKKIDEYAKSNRPVTVSKLQRYIHWVLPAFTALAAFLLSWGAYHNSYHYWGERLHKLANDPMQTEQALLDYRSDAFEAVKHEFEKGRKTAAKSYIKYGESRLALYKKAVKKAKRKRKRQARKAGGTDHAK
jgi:hypothetical protein